MAANLETEYLSLLGDRVRAWRTEHGMTRKALSAACGVSERYLAQLEAGEGNASVLLLRIRRRFSKVGAASGYGLCNHPLPRSVAAAEFFGRPRPGILLRLVDRRADNGSGAD